MADVIRVGIVGCGGRGIGLGRDMERAGIGRVTALCDISEKNLRAAGEIFSQARPARSIAELGGRDDVDAVIVSTTDDTHVDVALELKPFGKHLLVEKPLAIAVEDCDRLVNGFAGENDTVQMVGLCMRYNNLSTRIHKLVRRGLIGEIMAAHCIDNVSVGGDYYFHRWMSRKKHTVGLLLQKGCHSLDLISWIIGSRPVKVHAFGGLDYYGGDESPEKVCHTCDEFDECTERMETRVKYDYIEQEVRVPDSCAFSTEVDVKDNAVVNVLYESGAKLSYTECHFTPDYVREFQFIGTEGRIRAWTSIHGIREMEITFRHRPKKKMFETVEMDPGGHGGGDPAMLREFVAAIREARRPLTDFHAGRECAVTAISAEMSTDSGEVIDILNVDGTKRAVVKKKGRARALRRSTLLDRTPLWGEVLSPES